MRSLIPHRKINREKSFKQSALRALCGLPIHLVISFSILFIFVVSTQVFFFHQHHRVFHFHYRAHIIEEHSSIKKQNKNKTKQKKNTGKQEKTKEGRYRLVG